MAKLDRFVSRGAVALRRIAKQRGLSQGAIRKAVNVQPGVVTRWFSGERRPSARSAVELERLYGIKPELWWQDTAEHVRAPRAVGKTGTDD